MIPRVLNRKFGTQRAAHQFFVDSWGSSAEFFEWLDFVSISEEGVIRYVGGLPVKQPDDREVA